MAMLMLLLPLLLLLLLQLLHDDCRAAFARALMLKGRPYCTAAGIT